MPNDPRPDRDDRPHPSPPKEPGKTNPPSYPAPGGAGTGTKDDPSKAPDAQPDR